VTEQSDQNINESLIRLEAKIDVVLSRHEGKIDDLTRRQGEITGTLRDHDSRITANALTLAEFRAQHVGLAANLQAMSEAIAKRGMSFPSWAAVAVAALAIILSPILNTMLLKG
jgi:hypothetical protein